MGISMKKIVLMLVSAFILFSLVGCSSSLKTITKEENKGEGQYAGQTVILHTNDVHGALEGYAYLPTLKAAIEAEGGTVILVDAGDYTNGNIYVSTSKGASAVTLMNQVGYDIVTLGNHEFDFGYDNLTEQLGKGTFTTLCSNVFKSRKTIFDSEAIIKVGSLKIGFFALLTPETQTKVNPGMIQGLNFTEVADLYSTAQKEVDALKKECDVIVCVAHLGVDDESTGNRSVDLFANVTGIDFIIDGHSHTVMTEGPNNEPIQSTGTAFANVGSIVIDNASKKIVGNSLIEITEETAKDELVLATAKNVIDTVDAEFGAKFAETTVYLNGVKAEVRSEETNLGDLIADAMLWSVTNETTLPVPAENIIAVTNGGGIRASIEIGDVSRSSIKTVLPFGNTLTVCYLKGSELLEALEASTYCTQEPIGGFPQIAGMQIKIDTTIEFDSGEEYPNSTYHMPASIKRVSILNVNGKEFDLEAIYAVVTNNFCSAGGDTYYVFNNQTTEYKGFDTSIAMDEAVVNYIQMQLGGTIGEQYASPLGRIQIVYPTAPEA